MKLWRSAWMISTKATCENVYISMAKSVNADYVIHAADKAVIISKVVEALNQPYILSWFRNIKLAQQEYGNIIRQSMLSYSAEEFTAQINCLRDDLGLDAIVTPVSGNDKLLMCDLGDVIWDECMAQEHMRQIALRILAENGCYISLEHWKQVWAEIAETSEGGRFYRCVERVAGAGLVEKVRRAISDDFLGMSDAEYQILHPLRSGIEECFLALCGQFDVCFVANQPKKAYGLLRAYDLALVSPIWFLSCELGLKKPNPLFFKKCLDSMTASGHTYRACYMLGNRKDMDLIPGQQYGIKGILFLCPNSPICESRLHEEYKPWGEASSFQQLRQLLLRDS